MIVRLLLSTIFCLLLFSNAKADPVLVDTKALHYVNGTGLFEDFLATSLTLHPDIVAQQVFGAGNANGFVTFASQFSGAAGTLFHAEFIYDGQLIGTLNYVLAFDFSDNILIFGQEYPLSYTAKTAILNLNLGGVAASYTFTVHEPIPEPASLILMAIGLPILAAGIKNKLESRKSKPN